MGRVIAGADFGSNKTGYIVAEAKNGGLFPLARLAGGRGVGRRLERQLALAAADVADLVGEIEEPLEKDAVVARVHGRASH